MRKSPYYNVKICQLQPDGTSSEIVEKAFNIKDINKVISNFFFEYLNIQNLMQEKVYNYINSDLSGFLLILHIQGSGWETKLEINLIN